MTLKIKPVLCLLGIPIAMFGLMLLVFALLSLTLFKDGVTPLFLQLGAASVAGGCLLFFLLRGNLREFIFREAFLLVTLTWLTLGVIGGLPFMAFQNLTFTDAVFETISGLTTTGATMIAGLDREPATVLMYRQALQWIGGLGVIVMMIAILPMLNVGGMKVFKAETPGPMKDEKLTPRVYNTARALYLAYIFITLLCTVAFYLAGMSWYDAIGHSFTTLSTGGFSTHDASLGYYDSYAIEIVADFFMAISALSFGLHFKFLRTGKLNVYWSDEETRWYLMIMGGAVLAMMVYLRSADMYDSWAESLRFAAFEVISFMSSTGYGAADVPHWPDAAIFFLITVAYIGGCAGSTGGGSKVVRICIAIKATLVDMKQLLHPNGVFTLKYNGQPINDTISSAVSAFLMFNIVISVILTCVLVATGLQFLTALSAVAACLNVLGPAVGELGANYQPVNDLGTWILTIAMIMGRLDLFTVIVLVFPAYWRG